MCAGYGGALSVYFGLSAGMQQLDVSFFNLVLQSNVFTNCVVRSSPGYGGSGSGNVYGGAVSLYMGGYSSFFALNGAAVATAGDTVVRNVSVSLNTVQFTSCSATSSNIGSNGANAYGGSFSFYIGAYAWSYSSASSSSSACGTTTASGVSVSVSNTRSSNCSAVTTTSGGSSYGANSYGGSMSVVYVGAYAWSFSIATSSSSACGTTTASGVVVSVSNAPCSNCSAVTTTSGGSSLGANSYGGSMSVVYVGAYAWSNSYTAGNSSSACGTTTASDVSVSVSNAPSINCSAYAVATTSGGSSYGANSYGGSMSVVYVGAYAWSFSSAASSSSSSACGTTSASGVSVSVSNAPCSNCSAVTTTSGGSSDGANSFGANSYGGSMSVVYVGAYAWSYSSAAGSSSACGTTSASGVSVSVSNAPCSNCSAVTTSSGGVSAGANSYGGSMSVVYVGAYAWSNSFTAGSSSACGTTSASGVVVSVSNAPSFNCSAVTTTSGGSSYGANSYGANSYGGSMSVVYVGAYAWSFSSAADSSSACGATTASGVSVSVSKAPSINCSAYAVTTTSGGGSTGANSYGGSMSVVYVGAYVWSLSYTANSISACGATTASDVSVSVSNTRSSNCSAVTTMSGGSSYGANSYGGSMSVVYVGAYVWSSSNAAGDSSSACGTTTASGVSVSVSNAPCSNCSAVTTASGGPSDGANSYGGSMSVVYVGAYAWNSAMGLSTSTSFCDLTQTSELSISINTSTFSDSLSLSRKLCCVP